MAHRLSALLRHPLFVALALIGLSTAYATYIPPIVPGVNMTSFSTSPATVCNGAADDTPALVAALATGQNVYMPMGTCKFNTASYAAVMWPANSGTGYAINDTITLSNGVVTKIQSLALATSVLSAGGASYVVNDVLLLVCGTQDVQAYAKVLTVSGGVVLTYTMTNGGSFTGALPTSCTSTDLTTPAATGFTIGTLTWGVSWTTIQTALATSVVSNPVAQTATSGSGSGVTFNVTYAAGILGGNGQSLIGTGAFSTIITSTLANSFLFEATGSGNTISNLSFTLTGMSDGFAILVNEAKYTLIDNLDFESPAPGIIAIKGAATYTSINNIRIQGLVGGTPTLVSPLSGSTKAGFFSFGTNVHHSVAMLISKIIIGSGGNNVIANLMDGYADSPRFMAFNQNNGGQCIKTVNSFDASVKQPQFVNAWDYDCQTPNFGIAGYEFDTGNVFIFEHTFCNAAAAACVFFGPNASDLEMSHGRMNTAVGPIYVLAGTTAKIRDGVAFNAGSAGATTCTNVDGAGHGLAGGLCPAFAILGTASDIMISGVTGTNTVGSGNQSYGVDAVAGAGASGGSLITLTGNNFTGNLVGSWINEAGANSCGNTALNITVITVIGSGPCPTASTLIAAAGATIPVGQMVALAPGSEVAVWRSGAIVVPFTDTTDTATNLIAAINAIPGQQAYVGYTWFVRYQNNVQTVGATDTLAGGTGVTIAGANILNPGIEKVGRCVITNLTAAVRCTFG